MYLIDFFPRVACLPVLTKLQVTHNRLQTAADIAHLTECVKISVLDLSHNRIDDESIVDEVFAKMPELVSVRFAL